MYDFGNMKSEVKHFFQVFVDQIFRIFDKDGNGSIDFKVVTILIMVKTILILRMA